MEVKASMVAAANPGKAEEAYKEYVGTLLPASPEIAEAAERRKRAAMAEVKNMAPIPLSQIKFGDAIGGAEPSVAIDRRPAPDIKTFGTGHE